MTKRNAVVHLVALGALIAMGAVSAEARGKDNAAAFEAIDADGDGAVTEAELRAHAQARFDRADANDDGFLSREEMAARRASADPSGRAARMIERFDKDGNGMLDAAELEAAGESRMGRRAARMMERLDANSDGKLDFAEISARRDPAKMLERLDADGNGSLSAAEFAKAGDGRRKGH